MIGVEHPIATRATSSPRLSEATRAALVNPKQHFDSDQKCYLISAVSGNAADGNYKIKDTGQKISVLHQQLSSAASHFHEQDYKEIKLTDSNMGANQKLAYKLVMTNEHFNARKVANSIKELMAESPEQFIELIRHMHIKRAANVMNHIIADHYGDDSDDSDELNKILKTLGETQPNVLAQMLFNGAPVGEGKPSYTMCIIQRLSSVYSKEELITTANKMLTPLIPEGKALLLKHLFSVASSQSESLETFEVMVSILNKQLNSMPEDNKACTIAALKVIAPGIFDRLKKHPTLVSHDFTNNQAPTSDFNDHLDHILNGYDCSPAKNPSTPSLATNKSVKPSANEPVKQPVQNLGELENLTELTLGFGTKRSKLILDSITSVVSDHIKDKQQIAILSQKILNKMKETGTELCYDTLIIQGSSRNYRT